MKDIDELELALLPPEEAEAWANWCLREWEREMMDNGPAVDEHLRLRKARKYCRHLLPATWFCETCGLSRANIERLKAGK